jgi:hypothetical protein
VGKDQPTIRIGQLWRRRHDGRAFIPVFGSDDGGTWLDRRGIKRTAADLRTKYVLVPIIESWPTAMWRRLGERRLPAARAVVVDYSD